MTKKYYEILEINENATQEEIKKSYRKLALKWHPDKWNNKSSEEKETANKEMREINKAYEILGDTEKRKRYDLGLTDFPADDFNFQYDPKEEVRKQEEELRRREVDIADLELEILKLEMKALDRSSTLNEIGAAFCFTLPRVRAEDLDPILWQPYQSWGEKVVKMEITIPKGKDRSEELKNFKEEMVKAIKEAEVTLGIREENKKKSEDDSELNQARKDAFGYIEKEMNERGLKVKDLGQYSNYQERINSLGEVWEIRNFREEVIGFISKLTRREPDPDPRQERERERAKPEEQAKQQKLNQKREEIISQITIALNQNPPLTNSDLSPQYQNWEVQISQMNELQLITDFRDKILADIQARRKDKKSAQEVKENLNKTQTGTKEEKEQAWQDLEKQETEKGYHDHKQEIENLKKAKATENPQEYGQEAQQKIVEKLKSNGIKEEELNTENQQQWQKLKNGQIQDPDQLVATESKIKQNIYQKEAEKKINNLTSRVKEILKSNSSSLKSQIATLKKELLAFINSSNIYYSAQKKVAENLLAQLESYSTTTDNNQNNNSVTPKNSPWKIVIPPLLIGTLLIISIILTKKIAKGKKSKKKKN